MHYRALLCAGLVVLTSAALGASCFYDWDPAGVGPSSGGAAGAAAGGGADGGGGSGAAGAGLPVIDEPCSGPADCPAGYECVDEYCCTSACDGMCEACNLAGHEGACTALPVGAEDPEQCSPGACDSVGECATGDYLWSIDFGYDAASEQGNSVAVDATGEVLLTGSFAGPVDFGGGLVDAGDGRQCFVARYRGETGEYLWAHPYGPTQEPEDFCVGNAIAASGSKAAVAGHVDGLLNEAVDFGNGCPAHNLHEGGQTAFAAVLDTSGTCDWSELYGETDAQEEAGTDIALDSQGNVLLVGRFRGVIDLGGNPLESGGPNDDAFIAKLAPDGQHEWSHGFGSNGTDIARAVAVAPNGDVAMTGSFHGTVDFGGGPFTTANSLADGFVASFSAAGVHQWSKQFVCSHDTHVNDVAVDGAGNRIVVGRFKYDLALNGEPPFASFGSEDLFIAKFDAAGALLWKASYGNGSDQEATGVAVDASNNIVVVGSTRGDELDFGGGSLQTGGGEDVFVVKLASDGTHLWSYQFGGVWDQRARGVTVDAAGSVVLVGEFHYEINFGGPTLIAPESFPDIFLAKLAR